MSEQKIGRSWRRARAAVRSVAMLLFPPALGLFLLLGAESFVAALSQSNIAADVAFPSAPALAIFVPLMRGMGFCVLSVWGLGVMKFFMRKGELQ